MLIIIQNISRRTKLFITLNQIPWTWIFSVVVLYHVQLSTKFHLPPSSENSGQPLVHNLDDRGPSSRCVPSPTQRWEQRKAISSYFSRQGSIVFYFHVLGGAMLDRVPSATQRWKQRITISSFYSRHRLLLPRALLDVVRLDLDKSARHHCSCSERTMFYKNIFF